MIKLSEKVTGSIHTLIALGEPDTGKTHLLDRIHDGCEAWGFRAGIYSREDHCLAITGTRRTPLSILPQIEAAARAFGFEVVPSKYIQTAAPQYLQLKRRDRA